MAVAKVSTSSVAIRRSGPGVRKARLTWEIRLPSAAAVRFSPSSTTEDVPKLSVRLDRCAEVTG